MQAVFSGGIMLGEQGSKEPEQAETHPVAPVGTGWQRQLEWKT